MPAAAPVAALAGHGGAGVVTPHGGVVGVGPVAGVGVPVPVTVGGAAGVSTAYQVTMHGTNGFLREFAGGHTPTAEVTVELTDDQVLKLVVTNTGKAPLRATIADVTCGDSPDSVQLDPGRTHTEEIDAGRQANGWYDLRVTVDRDPAFTRRFAGHLENGENSRTGPDGADH